jgi:uncharacterized membrane protein
MTRALVIALTVLSALGSGLVAGVFFAFSSFVMGALGRLAPGQGIAAMQSINVVVINPWFFAAFFGTAAACLVLAVFGFFNWGQPGVLCLLAGSALYLFGSILVTMAFNVPLNDALAAVQPESADGAALWTRYLSVWTAWNHVRTVGSLAAAASFIVAALRMG